MEKFASSWRLSFTHPDPLKTKSHCIIFGSKLLGQTPQWLLDGQELRIQTSSVHLGISMDSNFHGGLHTDNRIKRARGAFFSLTPAGILNAHLAPFQKAFLWRMVVAPCLTFGGDVAPLRANDIQRLEACQASCVKTALRLPGSMRHSSLMAALDVPTVQEVLRRKTLRTLHTSFESDHRLRQALLNGFVHICVSPKKLHGSFLGLVSSLCGDHIVKVLNVVNGKIPRNIISAPHHEDGLTDSIRTALSYEEPFRSTVLWLLCRSF